MIKYFKKYAANKTSFFLLGSVYLAAGLTFLSLLFLLVYILVQGLPHINCDLFAFEYTTQNVSLLPAIGNYGRLFGGLVIFCSFVPQNQPPTQ